MKLRGQGIADVNGRRGVLLEELHQLQPHVRPQVSPHQNFLALATPALVQEPPPRLTVPGRPAQSHGVPRPGPGARNEALGAAHHEAIHQQLLGAADVPPYHLKTEFLRRLGNAPVKFLVFLYRHRLRDAQGNQGKVGRAATGRDIAHAGRGRLPPHVGERIYAAAKMPPLDGNVAGQQHEAVLLWDGGGVVADSHHPRLQGGFQLRSKPADQVEFVHGRLGLGWSRGYRGRPEERARFLTG